MPKTPSHTKNVLGFHTTILKATINGIKKHPLAVHHTRDVHHFMTGTAGYELVYYVVHGRLIIQITHTLNNGNIS